jgi:TRAP-type C4-dicarboxylate transport system permease small subunit
MTPNELQNAQVSVPPQKFGLISIVRRIGSALAIASGLGILVLMLFTTADVAMRAISGSGIFGSIEITQVALVAIVFAGMMLAELSQIHVRTPLLTERMPVRVAAALRIFGSAVAAFIVGWANYYSWRVGIASYAAGEFQFGLAEVPIWPAKLVLSLGLSGLLVGCLLNLYMLIRGLASPQAEIADPLAGEARLPLSDQSLM